MEAPTQASIHAVIAAALVVSWIVMIELFSGIAYLLVFSYLKRQIILTSMEEQETLEDMTSALWIATGIQAAVLIIVLLIRKS